MSSIVYLLVFVYKNKKIPHPFWDERFRGATQIAESQPLCTDAVKRITLTAPKVDTELSDVGFQHPDSLLTDAVFG